MLASIADGIAYRGSSRPVRCRSVHEQPYEKAEIMFGLYRFFFERRRLVKAHSNLRDTMQKNHPERTTSNRL